MDRGSEAKEALVIDIFGTAILTPWNKFGDYYVLLDDLFYKKTKCGLIFHQIRSEAGNEKGQCLHDIYNRIHEIYGIEDAICNLLEEQESSILLKYSAPRLCVKEIYEKILQKNVQVIFCTDVLYDEKVLSDVLKSCNYKGEYNVCSVGKVRNMLEKGDFDTVTFLGDKDLFENSKVIFRRIPDTLKCLTGVADKRVNGLHSFYIAAGNLVQCEKAKNSVGFSIMQQVIANKFFTDPFYEWKDGSEFNADPYYLGYYALGMHLMGLLKWFDIETKRIGCKRILFCARDGYVIKQAYDKYREIFPDLPESIYIQASRKALLPTILKKKEDFYFIPDLLGGASYDQYSPEILMLLLWDFTVLSDEYCFGHIPQQIREKYIFEIQKAGFTFDQNFQSYEAFMQFIRFFIERYHNEDKHDRMYQATKRYYEQYNVEDVLFDSGYSGKLPRIITELSSGIKNVFYLYTNEDTAEYLTKQGGFEIRSFYPYTPCEEAMIREFLIAEHGPTCRGFLEENGEIKPFFETENKRNKDVGAIDAIHRGGLEFVKDLLGKFGEDIRNIPYKPYEVSLPFEGFIRDILPADREMFSLTYQEDYYTGVAMGFAWSELYERTMEKFPAPQISWDERSIPVKRISELVWNNNKLAFWGCGKVFKRLCEQYEDFKPVLLLDNFAEQSFIDDIPLRKPEEVKDLSQYFIVITTDRYEEISNLLCNYGLRQGKNFIWYKEVCE